MLLSPTSAADGRARPGRVEKLSPRRAAARPATGPPEDGRRPSQGGRCWLYCTSRQTTASSAAIAMFIKAMPRPLVNVGILRRGESPSVMGKDFSFQDLPAVGICGSQ